MKAVIFDLFETLVSFSFEEYNKVLASMADQLEKIPEMFISSWHRDWPNHEKGVFKNLADYIVAVSGPALSVSALREAVGIHKVFQKQTLIPNPQTITILKSLKNAGYKIGLITNCPIETPALWEESPLSALVDVAVFSTVERTRKPDPTLFLSCAQRLECSPDECIYVGDGANQELSAASAVGMYAIGLCKDNEEGHGKHWSGTTVSNLSELILQIEKIETPSHPLS